MSVSELTEGLKKKVALLGIVNPSVKPSVCQLPVRGAFWCAVTIQKLSPLAGKVAANEMSRRKGNDSKLYKAPRCSSSIFTISYFHPPLGGFHIAQAIFHCA